MHLVASFGLVTFLGGLDFVRLTLKGSFFENFWADMSKLMMLITGSIFVYLCFMSFRFARNIRKNQRSAWNHEKKDHIKTPNQKFCKP